MAPADVPPRPNATPMGRETRILLGLLGLLAGVFVGVLSLKLLVPRPPAGAGPDVHGDLAFAMQQELVPPPMRAPRAADFAAAPPLVAPSAAPDAPEATAEYRSRFSGEDAFAADRPLPDLDSPAPAARDPFVQAAAFGEAAVDEAAAPAGRSRFAREPFDREIPPSAMIPDIAPADVEPSPPGERGAFGSAPAAVDRIDDSNEGGPPRVGLVTPPAAITTPYADPIASPPAAAPLAMPREVVLGPITGTHVVAPGDSWWSLAERAYGDGRLYRALFAWNRALEPRVTLLPGTQLEVPTIEKLSAAWPALVPLP